MEWLVYILLVVLAAAGFWSLFGPSSSMKSKSEGGASGDSGDSAPAKTEKRKPAAKVDITAELSKQQKRPAAADHKLLLATLPSHKDDVNHVSLSPDGSFAASVSRDRAIRLFHLEAGVKFTPFLRYDVKGDEPTACTFSPDSKYLCTAMRDSRTLVFYAVSAKGGKLSLEQKHEFKTAHKEPISSIVFGRNSSFVATCARGQGAYHLPEAGLISTVGG